MKKDIGSVVLTVAAGLGLAAGSVSTLNAAKAVTIGAAYKGLEQLNMDAQSTGARISLGGAGPSNCYFNYGVQDDCGWNHGCMLYMPPGR